MPRIKEEEINRIREKANIVEVIGKYLPLIRKGNDYVAICPFHDDHDPSLRIKTDGQFYKCFVCGAKGNVFSFVKEYENISFFEAVVKVAEIINEPLEYNKNDLLVSKYSNKQLNLIKLNQTAISFFNYSLFSEIGKEALEYLHNRGYSDDLIKTFDIGYNPDSEALYKFLKAKGFSEKEMIEANLIRSSTNGFTDVFKNRLIFPFFNTDAKPIAFNGRALLNGQEPKYINSSETILYVKGDNLFNLDKAKKDIKDKGLVYVCEGVTDVFAFYRAGIKNCVATFGTAMSKSQINLLKNLHSKVILAYDGDNAGQNANYKNAKLLIENNIEVLIMINETGFDPDEIIKNLGLDKFKTMTNNTVVFLEFVLTYLAKKYDLSNYSQRKDYCIEAIKDINTIKDNFDRKNFMDRLSNISGFTIDQLTELVSLPKEENENKQKVYKSLRTQKINGKLRAEYEIISEMLASSQAAQLFKEKLGYLPDNSLHQIAMNILDYYHKESKMNISILYDQIIDESNKNLVLDLVENDSFAHVFDEKAMLDAFNKIKISIIDDKITDIKKQLVLVTNAKEKEKLNSDLIELRKQRLETI